MRKRILFSGFLVFLVVLASFNTFILVESADIAEEDYCCHSDISAPDILFDVSYYNDKGEIYGLIFDYISPLRIADIYDVYTEAGIRVNGENLDRYEANFVEMILEKRTVLGFHFDVDDLFDHTPGVHNFIDILVYNNEDFKNDTINSNGGSGGGGGFGFCDTVDCWGYPVIPKEVETQDSYTINQVKTIEIDNTAPIPFINLTRFKCCGIVDIPELQITDNESGVKDYAILDASSKVREIDSYFPNTTIIETQNFYDITSRIILNWNTTLCDLWTSDLSALVTDPYIALYLMRYLPLDCCPKAANFPLIVSFLPIAFFIIFVIQRRSKKH